MRAESPAVLVLDDDPAVRQAISWALEDEGLPVRLGRDGLEGLELIQDAPPGLVVLDIGLPRMDGNGFATELRRRYGEDVPILVITADGRAEEKARRVGAFDFMPKPFDMDALVGAVKRGLQP